jgi:predicted phage terminase large subunit-like protein
MMSHKMGREERESLEWVNSPADTAAHLSRGQWIPAAHLRFISDKLTQIREGPIFLIVNMPPRHGKSELISHWTPIWFLKNYPQKHVILASYQQGFASDWGGIVKNTIIDNESELGISLTQDTKAKNLWKIKGFGGGMFSTGVLGALTGRGGDLIIIDDPIKSQKEALSLTYRNSTYEWYRASLRPRLQPGGSIIILQTRWHEDDLVGRLLADSSKGVPNADRWEVINLPALAGKNDPLGRQEGEALWPEMYPVEALEALKETLGAYWWSAEFQGAPRVAGGAIVKEEWFGYFDFDPFNQPGYERKAVIQVWDTAYEKGDLASRSACITAIDSGAFVDIVDVWYGKPNFPELQNILKMKYNQFKPERIYVEAKASGKSLVQQIRTDTNYPILELRDNDDKTTRLHSVSGIVEAGKVRLKARSPWLNDFLYEVCGFPAAEHDDITDVFSYALRILRGGNSAQAWAEAFRILAERNNGQKEALTPVGATVR